MPEENSTYHLFIDDSGSSCPDRKMNEREDNLDVFALGGVIVKGDQLENIKSLHKNFMISHRLECPDGEFKNHLHSTKIRCKKNHFEFLKEDSKAKAFYQSLEEMIVKLPVVAHACVVHRSGYKNRYSTHTDKWQLCRSSYQILVERALKYVLSEGGKKLKVYVERVGKKEDKLIQSYHDKLRDLGMEFDVNRSSDYEPIHRDLLSSYLLRKIEFQTKASRIMQIADLLLYPLIKGGYDKTYPPYILLMKENKVVDTQVADIKTMGVKYYCFPDPQKDKKPHL